ncbi:MAG: hypothetical protein IPK17_02140 [Chloroflexi bacterium]|uniref:hypothetical protein n=1 Tax=Candidatus Flexifilum breve TaxID=3140694 RepID=UPI00313752C1|nr:hypothetical protein [Chloroflexota bacterium]
MSKLPSFPPKPSGQPTPTPPAPGQIPRPVPPNPLGSLGSRFGAKAMWEILPLTDTLISFELAAIADGLAKLFDLPADAPPVEAFLTLLHGDKAFAAELRERLDEDWLRCELHGAFMVYNWRDEIRQAMNARLLAIKVPPMYTLVRDPLLTLNVLGRARTALLLATAPLALDRPFLTRSLVCDDQRMAEIAQSRAFSVEHLIEPQDEEFDEEE